MYPAGPVTVTTYDVSGQMIGRETVVEATGGIRAASLGITGSGIRLIAVRAGNQRVILQCPQTSGETGWSRIPRRQPPISADLL
jgi:hypothetical protein